jgi:DNA repair exonuclease SbcCD ATPase subunit
MTEPIKLPPMPAVFGVITHPMYDADYMREYARLAVEQATADIAAEATNLMHECADLRARAEKAEDERDEALRSQSSALVREQYAIQQANQARTELAQARAELARLTTSLRGSYSVRKVWLDENGDLQWEIVDASLPDAKGADK